MNSTGQNICWRVRCWLIPEAWIAQRYGKAGESLVLAYCFYIMLFVPFDNYWYCMWVIVYCIATGVAICAVTKHSKC